MEIVHLCVDSTVKGCRRLRVSSWSAIFRDDDEKKKEESRCYKYLPVTGLVCDDEERVTMNWFGKRNNGKVRMGGSGGGGNGSASGSGGGGEVARNNSSGNVFVPPPSFSKGRVRCSHRRADASTSTACLM
ncbi:unnamed protein product, partial [Soboliphyme baturini]|uniref:Uncharacterized protein n=1 Tax=Soboliphyme baturini TaxID=241478 RepID=A0A183J5L8_9BILA